MGVGGLLAAGAGGIFVLTSPSSSEQNSKPAEPTGNELIIKDDLRED